MSTPLHATLVCVVCLSAGTAGCESAEVKCGKARDAAVAGWDAYVTALDRERARADAAQSETHRKLSHEVELRLSPGAQQVADSRYDRSSEAWRRAHSIALTEACASDRECSALKRTNTDAQTLVTDLDERLPLARAAQAAARGPADAAAKAAAATIVHPEYPQLKQARELTAQAVELCRDIPPANDPAAAPDPAR